MAVDHLTKTLFKNSQNPTFCWLLFKHLLSSPSPNPPTTSSISAIAQILARARMLTQLDHLHNLLLSLPPEPAFPSLSALIISSAKSNLLDRAIHLFQSLRAHFPSRPPSVRLYNALLESCFVQRRPQLVSFLFRDMILSGTGPDAYTFNVLISSLCELGCLEEARQLFEKMGVKGCKPNEFSFGILARGYCKMGLSYKGKELLDLMGEFGCLPNRVIYNTLISGFCKEGLTDEAEKLVERMSSDGISPDVVTFNSRISALCKSGNVLEAVNIFRDMEKGDGVELPRPNFVTYNLVLDGFCKVGLMEEAGSLIASMKDGGIFYKLESYNIWLSSLARNHRLLEAHSVLEEMVEMGIEPSIYSYNVVIDGLCKEGMVLDARSVLGLMRSKGVLPDVVTYSSLLHGFCSKGKFFYANRVLDEMMQNGCHPNTVTCNILLQSLWKQERASEAEKFVQKMNEKGYNLDTETCNIIISGLCKSGKLDKAIEIVSGMWLHGSASLGDIGNAFIGPVDSTNKARRCSPDRVSYSIIINALCKLGRFEEAKKKFIEMVGKDVAPDSVIYDIFIHWFCKYGKITSAFRALRDMQKSFNPSARTYNYLIQALGSKNQIDDVNDLINEMQNRGVVADVFTYNSLINGLCEGDKVREAASLIDEMLQEGVIPNVSSFSLLIKAFSKGGDFVAAQEAFEISTTILGHREPLYSLMFNELVSGGEVAKAAELLETAMERGIGIGGFSYKFFIDKLCKEELLEKAMKILNNMIHNGCTFDPAVFMPVIDKLGKNGRKDEGDKFSEIMLAMAVRSDKLSHKASKPQVMGRLENGTYSERYIDKEVDNSKPIKDSFSGSDWHTILHRDDGSGIAMKVLKRVQKGWGHGNIQSLKPQKNDFLDECEEMG